MVTRADYAMAMSACAGLAAAYFGSPLPGVLVWFASSLFVTNARDALYQEINFDEWLNAGDVENVVFIQCAGGTKYTLPDGALSKKWIKFFICKRDEILENNSKKNNSKKNDISEEDLQEFKEYIKDNFSISTTDSLSIGFSSRLNTEGTSVSERCTPKPNYQFICNFSDIKRSGRVPGCRNQELFNAYNKQAVAHNNEKHKIPDESAVLNCAEQNSAVAKKAPSGQLSACSSVLSKSFDKGAQPKGVILE